jgi:hypothetical protein
VTATKNDGTREDLTPVVRSVRNVVAECYEGSGRELKLDDVAFVAIHRISLTNRDDAANPHPIPDELLDGPSLATRFRNPALGTGGRTPYHLLVRVDGAVDQMVPLGVRGAHAGVPSPHTGYNWRSWAIAVVGEYREASQAQLIAAARMTALLLPATRGARVFGHSELPDATPNKVCPAPVVQMESFRTRVALTIPGGWQLADRDAAFDAMRAAGIVT